MVSTGNPGGSSSTPVNVSGVTAAVAVASGFDYNCALICRRQQPECWGRGLDGQLGNGFQTNSSIPVDVALVGGPWR
ncbi:MAG: hypothetical protein R3F24_06575 [Gammaproteobacteria bacterium]